MRLFRGLALTLIVAGTIAYTAPLTFAAKKPEGKSIVGEKSPMCHGIIGKDNHAAKAPISSGPRWQSAHTDKELPGAREKGVTGTAKVSF